MFPTLPSRPIDVLPLTASRSALRISFRESLAVPALFIASVLSPTPPALAADPVSARPVPPPGAVIADDERAELKGRVEALGEEIESLGNELKNKPAMLELLPDVRIFHKAVDWAIRYDEFFNPKEVNVAKKLLELGIERVKELRAGKPS